jgi:hypothetical protein
MSSIPFLTMFAGSENVTNVSYVDIDFSAASFDDPPVINASIEQNIELHVTNVTSTTARLNFSSNYTGRVSYLIRPTTA